MRAIVASIAAGNIAILKVGESFSDPNCTDKASLFMTVSRDLSLALEHTTSSRSSSDAGFPPGVLNSVVHPPRDAVETFVTLIKHPSIRKCNFTDSKPVGRAIASHAATTLEPVLLELGGQNCALVFADADLDNAAGLTWEGALSSVCAVLRCPHESPR